MRNRKLNHSYVGKGKYMKKRLNLLVVTGILAFGIYACGTEYDGKEVTTQALVNDSQGTLNNKGEYFLVKEEYYFSGELYEYCEYEYDDKGDMTSLIRYDAEGSINIKSTFQYDENNVLRYRRDEGKNVSTDTKYTVDGEYVYDVEGMLQKEISSYDDGTRIEMVYDKVGNVLSYKRYNESGELRENVEYEYDSHGNITKEWKKHIEDPEMQAVNSSTYEYEYNSEGLVTKKLSKTLNGILYRITEYEYDSEGRLIEEIGKDSEGTISIEYIYEYDKNGNMVKKLINQPVFNSTKVYEYTYEIKDIE